MATGLKALRFDVIYVDVLLLLASLLTSMGASSGNSLLWRLIGGEGGSLLDGDICPDCLFFW